MGLARAKTITAVTVLSRCNGADRAGRLALPSAAMSAGGFDRPPGRRCNCLGNSDWHLDAATRRSMTGWDVL